MHNHSEPSGQGTGSARPRWHDRQLFTSFDGILGAERHASAPVDPEELPVRREDYLFGGLTPSLAEMLPESAERREKHRRSLMAAGYRSRAAWANLTALRFVLAFLSLLAVGYWLIVAPPQFELFLLGLLVALPLLAWAIPPLVVSARAAERRIDIDRGLPDVLDMLNMGVSQGLTVPQCLQRISREVSEAHPALAEELRIVDRQTQFGSLTQALSNFSDRIESPEVATFTSLLIQSEATGTSISQALQDYSDSMRHTLRERADARANSASFWMLAPVTLCLMPSVFLFLLGPAIVQLDDFFGNRASELAEGRDEALDSLNQQPQLDLSQFDRNGL